MVVIKAPQMNLRNESAQCELCGSMMTGEEAQQSNQQFGASVCIPCIMREQQGINQENDMMFHSEPMSSMDAAWLLLKNDPDGIEGKYQCNSCEMMFDTPHEDKHGQTCPHCYGTFVEGSIDDPYTEEQLQAIE